jgi:hypothetical protein
MFNSNKTDEICFSKIILRSYVFAACFPCIGVVAIQASAAGPTPPASWRIAATAVVLEQEAELRIVKKLKLVGTPLKVCVNFTVMGSVNFTAVG